MRVRAWWDEFWGPNNTWKNWLPLFGAGAILDIIEPVSDAIDVIEYYYVHTHYIDAVLQVFVMSIPFVKYLLYVYVV